MKTNYATIEEFQASGYQIAAGQETNIGLILTAASRCFDRYVGCEDSLYGQVEEADTASARTYYGDGTNFLIVDPHISATTPTITAPTGFTVPSYTAVRKAHLCAFERTYGDAGLLFSALEGNEGFDGQLFALDLSSSNQVGWQRGVPYSVTAKWGWSATPGDVKEAVLETALAIFRGKDQGYARVVNLENGTVMNDAMPPRAKMIADVYRANRMTFA